MKVTYISEKAIEELIKKYQGEVSRLEDEISKEKNVMAALHFSAGVTMAERIVTDLTNLLKQLNQ